MLARPSRPEARGWPRHARAARPRWLARRGRVSSVSSVDFTTCIALASCLIRSANSGDVCRSRAGRGDGPPPASAGCELAPSGGMAAATVVLIAAVIASTGGRGSLPLGTRESSPQARSARTWPHPAGCGGWSVRLRFSRESTVQSRDLHRQLLARQRALPTLPQPRWDQPRRRRQEPGRWRSIPSPRARTQH